MPRPKLAKPAPRPKKKPRKPISVTELRRRLIKTESRLAEAEETLEAIRTGEVDALVVTGAQGEQVYTLKDAARPYQVLVEEMNEGVLTLSAQGRILYANARFAEMLHLPLGRILGEPLSRFTRGSDEISLRELIHAASEGRCRDELTLYANDISIPVQISLRNIVLDGVQRLTVLVADLTERKQAEERLRQWNVELEQRVQERTVELKNEVAIHQRIADALEESERKTNDLIRYAPTAIYEVDFRGPRFKTVNDAMCAMSGYTREELLAMSPFALLDADSRARFQARIQRALAGQELDPSVEYRVLLKDGRELYTVLTTTLTYENGKPVGAFVIAHDVTARKQTEQEIRRLYRELEQRAQDLETANEELAVSNEETRTTNDELQEEITERKRAESMLKERNAALRESEERFQLLAQNLISAVALIDERGEFRIVNKAFRRMFDLDERATILNINSRDWSQWRVFAEDGTLLDVDEHPARKAALTHAAVRDKLVAMLPPGQTELVWLLISAEPILDDQGNVHRLICTYHDITERKRAEQALQAALQAASQSEERFRLSMQATQDGLWDWNIRPDEVYFSPGYYHMLGYEMGGFPEKSSSWRERVHPDDRARAMQANQDCIDGRTESFAVEFRMQAKDGTWRWILGRGKCIARDAQGRAIRMVGTHVDVTERKQMEVALTQAVHQAENHQRVLEAVIQQMPVGVILTDGSGTVAKNNPAMDRIWRREMQSSENVDRHDYIAYHPDGREYRPEEWPLTRSLRQGEEIVGEEMVIQRGDGTQGTVHVSSAPIRDGNGQIIAGVVVDVDMTERKQAESLLIERNAALRASEDKFSKAFKHSPYAITITRLSDGKIIEGNDSAYALFGYSPDEVIGKTTQELGIWTNPEDRQRLTQGLAAQGYLRSEEFVLKRKDGTLVTVDLSAALIPVGDERCFLASFVDITERKRVEKERERLSTENQRRATELEIANRELDAFTYSVSHDLRAPLAFIRQFADVLLEDSEALPPEDYRRYLHLIDDNAAAMSRLIEDLLLLSRSTRQPLRKQPVNQQAMARGVQAALRDAHPDRQIEWVVGALPTVEADPVLLKQVWTNLISNAVKFTRECEAARIEIGACLCDGAQAYFVKDNGVGFDMEQADKLFGVFQRLHSADEYEGTGVGLAIVERIVKRHGGRVWAEAAVNQGATFYFTLP